MEFQSKKWKYRDTVNNHNYVYRDKQRVCYCFVSDGETYNTDPFVHRVFRLSLHDTVRKVKDTFLSLSLFFLFQFSFTLLFPRLLKTIL